MNKAKWEAWRSLGAISEVTTAAHSHFSTVHNANDNFAQEEARQQYCNLIGSLAEAEGGAVAAVGGTEAFETLKVMVEDNITTIRLNRPEKKNAITTQVSVNECILLAKQLLLAEEERHHQPGDRITPNSHQNHKQIICWTFAALQQKTTIKFSVQVHTRCRATQKHKNDMNRVVIVSETNKITKSEIEKNNLFS